ncbi:Nucleoside diphosphate kinase [Koleobacter methoxysyntrophicus]|uniref:Nucleoside diphosphate kinase n=1 Tax=Koleobacter methoxysyntrophicus TaxID=2751313 RepID=A0A8A0RSH0_9FIRM|nr:nucleoside-diphosphate kinase [Koleobacter methoxysyntrophicus]MDI3540863.1 nucleoside-diphosphate kinase [Thermosediminibacterales bacterium]QSQ10126.1 Nucleoside diphosphate kinase [Koleobacter methoxysyntrophicus]
METTFVMIKPDGVKRRIVGEIIHRLEKKGLEIVDIKLLNLSKELAEEHYSEHKGKEFFDQLIEYITSGPVIAMVVKGNNAIQAVRQLMGNTDPIKAAPGTIRGDYGLTIRENLVHGSDSLESSKREISLFFNKNL